MRSDYERRILRVLDHIFANPAGDLSLERLADIAAMSKYHWHRIFRAMTGESIAEAVRRIRLQRASMMLVHEEMPVAEVARLVGYPNVAAFSRAFSAAYGKSPLSFRQTGHSGPGNPRFRTPAPLTLPFELRDLPPLRVAALAHQGDYNRIDLAFERIYGLAASRRLFPDIRGLIGVFHDDPALTPVEQLQSHAGFVMTDAASIEPPFEPLHLRGGKHVVATIRGPYSQFAQALDQLWNVWLPDSGEEAADAPAYFFYVNSLFDTPAPDLITELRLPLA